MQALHRVNGVVTSHQDKVVVVPSLNGTSLPANNNNSIGSTNTDILTLSRLASLSKTFNQSGGGGGGGGMNQISSSSIARDGQVQNFIKRHYCSLIDTKSSGLSSTQSGLEILNQSGGGGGTSETSSSSIGRDGQVQNFIKRHCCSLIDTKSSHLSSTQSGLENRVKSSLKTLRSSQLRMSHAHTLNELISHKKRPKVEEEVTPLLLTVDGSSNTSFNSSIGSSSNGSLLAPPPLPSDGKVSSALQQHLHCLESFIDEEATDTSSDEEEEMEALPNNGKTKSKNDRYIRKLAVKQRWEKDRAQLGARWAWLCHQILTLNQKLYQLDSRTQAQDPKETVQLTPHNPPPSPLNLPNCVCGLQNGHSDHKIPGGQPPQRGNGSTLLSKPPLGGKVNGGVTCSCQFRQMLLSNQSLMMSHPLQVGDLVGCSFPVLVMDEANQVSARTRGTHRAPKRKLVRMKEKRHERRRKRKGSGCSTVDESYHPHLSQEGDVSSNVWLDSSLHQVLQEHSYASLPLPKKRKVSAAASTGPASNNCSTVTNLFDHAATINHSILRLERSKSFSPSPLDVSSATGEKGIPRKRHSANSFDDSSHPVTPTSLKKKKGVTTPQYDINNIVIPYSILSTTTRLEKLEYKEIITPKWRKVSSHPAAPPPLPNGEHIQTELKPEGVKENGVVRNGGESVQQNGDKETVNFDHDIESDEEDDSDTVFAIRHDRCEAKERNRYLNFVTGNRKRPRPSQLSSTPDSGSLSPSFPSTPPPLERVPQVPPWSPRKFPLAGKDLDYLTKAAPVPPPLIKKVIQYVPVLDYRMSSSPSPLPNHTPSTPPPLLTSPVAPEGTDECPLSNSQWMATTHVKHLDQPPTTSSSSGIILKLSKPKQAAV